MATINSTAVRRFLSPANPRRDPVLAVALAVVVPLVILAVSAVGLFDRVDMGVVLFVGGAVLVAAPILIAVERKHRYKALIVALSLLGFVPFVGWLLWLAALIVAVGVPARAAAAQDVGYGAVANGHVLVRSDGGPRWVPLERG